VYTFWHKFIQVVRSSDAGEKFKMLEWNVTGNMGRVVELLLRSLYKRQVNLMLNKLSVDNLNKIPWYNKDEISLKPFVLFALHDFVNSSIFTYKKFNNTMSLCVLSFFCFGIIYMNHSFWLTVITV
jgi:hypothetical protein